MNSSIAVKVENLSKSYKLYDRPVDRLKESLHPLRKSYHRDFYALQNVSFDIKRGETVGIIGKNGSGKSTLLKMITGVLTPSGGEIGVNGKISALLELGAGFNPEFTGIENIFMNGTIMGFSKEEMDGKLNAIVDFADIGEFIHQPVKMYSSGMFARLAFAVAINIEPDILIVDEALSVGDVFFQNKCFKKFQELKAKNVTILFVSHDMGSIKQMTQRVLWLNEGRQKMFDATELVCEAYFNEQLQLHNALNQDLEAVKDKVTADIVQKDGKLVVPELCASGKTLVSKDVAIRSFFMKESGGKRVECLKAEQEYTAVFVAEFSRAMEDLIFGFVLENNKGIEILGINSFINNQERLVEVKRPCVMMVEFRFTLPRILKGEYLVSPAVAQGVQGQNVILTWLPGIAAVTIENTGYNLSLLELEAAVTATEYSVECVEFR